MDRHRVQRYVVSHEFLNPILIFMNVLQLGELCNHSIFFSGCSPPEGPQETVWVTTPGSTDT